MARSHRPVRPDFQRPWPLPHRALGQSHPATGREKPRPDLSLKSGLRPPERTRFSSWALGGCQCVRIPDRGRHGRIAAPKSLSTLAGSVACGSVFLRHRWNEAQEGLKQRACRPGDSPESGAHCAPTTPSQARRLTPAGVGQGNPVSEDSQGSEPPRTLAEVGQGASPPTPNYFSDSVPNSYLAQSHVCCRQSAFPQLAEGDLCWQGPRRKGRRD